MRASKEKGRVDQQDLPSLAHPGWRRCWAGSTGVPSRGTHGLRERQRSSCTDQPPCSWEGLGCPHSQHGSGGEAALTFPP